MFQRWFFNLPIKQKLFSITLSVMAVISIMSLLMLLFLTLSIVKSQKTQATTEAIYQYFSTPEIVTVLQNQPEQAEQFMKWMEAMAEISSASLISDQKVLYGFSVSAKRIQPLNPIDLLKPDAQTLELNNTQPKLSIQLRYKPWFNNGLYIAFLFGVIIVTVSAILLMLVSRTVVKISLFNPIQHLISIAELVTSNEDFKTRAKKFHNDEIGTLVDRFNEMMSRIETRDQQLQLEKNKAESANVRTQRLSKQTSKVNSQLELEVQIRTKIERKLTEFQSYLNSIIDSMPSALIALDEYMTVTLWNKKATTFSGMPIETAMGCRVEKAYPLLGNYINEIKQALKTDKVLSIESVSALNNVGERVQFDLIIYPLVTSKTRGAVIRIDDVSEKNRMEEMIVQTEKMMSIGGLAAGMAHEINNPLSAIIQGVQNIERRISTDLPQNLQAAEDAGIDMAAMQEFIESRRIDRFLVNIKKAGERAAQIVTNMLQFSRIPNPELKTEQLDELINRALEIVSGERFLFVGEGSGDTEPAVAITLDTSGSNFNIRGMSQEIEQVIVNLLKNAVYAVKKKQEQQPDTNDYQPKITITLYKDEMNCIVQVEDNGIGMTEEVKKRIFEPFFTTKDVGSGTGLGLSVSYFIITSHHQGVMEVDSNPGVGTTFTFKIPNV